MVLPVLPRAQSPIAGREYPAAVWYDFFRQLRQFVSDNEGNTAQIDAILARLTALEAETQVDALFLGIDSVQVFGTMAGGLIQITLQGDEDQPGQQFYYGTGPTGEKGFFPAASLVMFMVDENGDFLVDENGDFLISQDITADLFAIVNTGYGMLAHTGNGTWEERTLVAGAGLGGTNLDGIAGPPELFHEDTSSVANLTSNNSGTVVIQDFTITFDTFGHVQTVSVGTVDVAAALAATFQPLDATLTALAAADWALNSVPIGIGADVLAQTFFPTNTFPGRTSVSDLVPQTITDFAYSILDDASASAVRTTLGLGTAAVASDSDYVHIAGTETVTGAKLFGGAGSGVQLANPTWQWRTETATRRYRWQYAATDAADGAYNLDKWNGAAFVNVLNINTGATILTMVGNVSASVLVSTVATGTAPFTVTSTTKVTNLNADLLDDQSGAFYLARANHTGTQTMSTISDLPTLAHGTYTPTGTTTTNADSVTTYASQYLRVGDTVTVSGKVDIDPTAAGTCEVRLSLPIASTFASDQQCGGTAAASAIHQSVRIQGGAGVTSARFVFQAPDGTARSYNFSFTYLVV